MADIEFSKFAGINNVLPEERLTNVELTEAVNVDIDETSRVRRRAGFVQKVAGAVHSVFASDGICLFRQGAGLYRYYADGSTALLQSGLTADAQMKYVAGYNGVFYGDGATMGFTDGNTAVLWGVPVPAQQPAALGDMGGRQSAFMYAMTYVRADGEESGTPAPGQISATSRLDFTWAAPPAGVAQVALYLSHPDGATMFRVGLFPAGTTSTTVQVDSVVWGMPLDGLYQRPPPPSRIVAMHNGTALVAVGQFLMYSDAFRPERFDALRRVVTFPHRITLVSSVNDAVLVGTTEALYWLTGRSIHDAGMQVLAGYGALEGTDAFVDGPPLQPGNSGTAFATTQGFCVAGAGGEFHNLTRERFWPPASFMGGGAFRRVPGLPQYVVALN